jgi:hypothetical protein
MGAYKLRSFSWDVLVGTMKLEAESPSETSVRSSTS